MRIVSLNAWGGARFDALAPWISGLTVDVLCPQEVTRTAGLGGWTTFRDDERTLSQRANLFADVEALLPGFQGSFVASDSGPVEADRPVVCSGEHRQDFGLAVFVAERFPAVGQLSEFVYGDFADHDRWPSNGRPRLAQGVRLLDRENDRFVTVVHLHGLRHTDGKGDTPSRRGQAERLVALVERLRAPDDLTIVCGDLNLMPDSETFAILAELGLVELVGTADTRTSSYTKPTRHANYLLVSDPDAVRHLAIPAQPEVSDHRPLILEI